MFVFSIDNHNLTVISTDFVAIHPYTTTSVRIGIGQRYNVILTAQPIGSTSRSFWMRAYRPQCFNANSDPSPTEGYEKAGILFYDDEIITPSEDAPGWPVDTVSCSDEPYAALTPFFPWQVGQSPAKVEDDLSINLGFGSRPVPFPLAGFSIGGVAYNPLRINYSNPTILNLTWEGAWFDEWVVYPENYTSSDWVSYRLVMCRSLT